VRVLKEAFGRVRPGKMDYHYALLHLPGRSPAGIFNQWKAITHTVTDGRGKPPTSDDEDGERSSHSGGKKSTRISERKSRELFASGDSDNENEENGHNFDDLTDKNEEHVEFVKLWGSTMKTELIAKHYNVSKGALYKRLARLKVIGSPEIKRRLDEACRWRAERARRKQKRGHNEGPDAGSDEHSVEDAPPPKRRKIEFDNCTLCVAF
jgi:hypothetical protein